MESENHYTPQQETTRVGTKLYDVELLKSHAEAIEVQEVSLDELRENVSEGNYFWDDRNGEKLGPAQILKDWESAQQNPAWVDHVQSIKRANLDNPIWVMRGGLVFDGMHRLTKAFLEKVEKIKVKIFDSLPESAVIKDK